MFFRMRRLSTLFFVVSGISLFVIILRLPNDNWNALFTSLPLLLLMISLLLTLTLQVIVNDVKEYVESVR
ncbi:hypothetical protein FLK61_27380 [Paenalkalicoccus suaedae]|uniref:Uncharacterized protein n=1 Tax=Paenalkalicoccus suaedae TaxID=2592382 RepID=A0A859FB39_9BACI|nr:hypothetical protein [Paenalkalicoccus suaedae]QKS70479.1 hypothetical protein FLK61_27380 [Paenalkalicoccus suaedae]